jgi:hypothetical protein
MKRDAEEILRRYGQAKTNRTPYENDFRTAARLILPRDYARWQTDGAGTSNIQNFAGAESARAQAVDSTAMRALPKYVSVLDRILTPQGQKWQRVEPRKRPRGRWKPNNRDLLKIPAVGQYFDDVNTLLFEERYHPRANFVLAQTASYGSIGVYGHGVKFISARKKARDETESGLLYRAIHASDCFHLVNHEGRVDTMFRRMYLTARQFKQKWPDAIVPPSIAVELGKAEQSDATRFEIVHLVGPYDDYDPGRLDKHRFPFMDVYVSAKDRCFVGDHDGYNSFPYVVPRPAALPEEEYGWSPAAQALAAIGGANQIKRTLLKQGNKAVDPVLLANDDGVLGGGRVDLRPGAINYGAIDSQGRRMIQAMETGRFDVGEKLLEAEQGHINDTFLVWLFQTFAENSSMTATEVVQRVSERAGALAPTMGIMQSEDLGPTVERELDVLHQLGFLPEPPPELVEAGGEYSIAYTSPMAKSMQAEEVEGFMNVAQFAMEAAKASGDPRPLKRLNFDAAIPAIARIRNVPTRWLLSDDEMAAADEATQNQQDTETAIKAAPAVAGLMKGASNMAAPGAPGAQQ